MAALDVERDQSIEGFEQNNHEMRGAWLEIFSGEITYEFAESGYDFSKGKDKIAIDVFRKHLKK